MTIDNIISFYEYEDLQDGVETLPHFRVGSIEYKDGKHFQCIERINEKKIVKEIEGKVACPTVKFKGIAPKGCLSLQVLCDKRNYFLIDGQLKCLRFENLEEDRLVFKDIKTGDLYFEFDFLCEVELAKEFYSFIEKHKTDKQMSIPTIYSVQIDVPDYLKDKYSLGDKKVEFKMNLKGMHHNFIFSYVSDSFEISYVINLHEFLSGTKAINGYDRLINMVDLLYSKRSLMRI